MTIRKRSFRNRITVAFALLAMAVCIFFAIAVVVTFQTIEHHLFGKRLMAEVEWIATRPNNGSNIELPPTRHFYVDKKIPEKWQSLAHGYYDIEDGNANNHVAVLELQGHRFVLVSDESDFEHLESLLYIALIVGGITGTAVAVWLGRLTAGRIISPLTRLADAITSDVDENKLPGLNDSDEIGALARAFSEKSEELREYLQRERLFTGDVSHELRTPLTVILGAAEVIQYHSSGQPTLAAAAERIQRATKEMTDRVQAFLMLSRGPGQIDLHPLALLPLVKDEIERCRSILAGKDVRCILENVEDTTVLARPELAAMAIGNLVRNACQYTEQGFVRIALYPQHLVVEDTGPGLPLEIQTHLFERFITRHNVSISGSGLGLAIVKRISDHLDWRIRWEQRAEGGSRFILTFHA